MKTPPAVPAVFTEEPRSAKTLNELGAKWPARLHAKPLSGNKLVQWEVDMMQQVLPESQVYTVGQGEDAREFAAPTKIMDAFTLIGSELMAFLPLPELGELQNVRVPSRDSVAPLEVGDDAKEEGAGVTPSCCDQDLSLATDEVSFHIGDGLDECRCIVYAMNVVKFNLNQLSTDQRNTLKEEGGTWLELS